MLQIESYLKRLIEETLDRLNYPLPSYQFDRPKLESHGDISVNVAMLLARPLKQNPRQIATEILQELNLDPELILKTDIAGPGFINFFLATPCLVDGVKSILQSGEEYGRAQQENRPTALVEFVSANPTGPLTVGHGRQAVLGDTMANLLEWAGYTVTREYYFNNAGRQMRVLGNSVRLRYLELLGEDIEFPDDHYQGEYIKDIAATVLKNHGDDLKDATESPIFKDAAEEAIFDDIKQTLASINIVFDTFFNESDLYENGDIDRVIARLKSQGLAYESEGAVWFRATNFGLEKDRVIVKSSGEPTYRLPDIAYHCEKFERGYDLMIDIFGADHIATYPDVLAGLTALGYEADKVKVLIHQFVTLFEGNEKVKMSTRKANFITLDELIEDVGADVSRWFFVMRSMQSHLNFDIQLAKTQSDENPVFYNQYAHARICTLLRKAEAAGIHFNSPDALVRLGDPGETQLIKKLMDFPRIIAKSAENYEPHLITQFLSEISTAFHKFYTDCRVMSEDAELTQARLGLCIATRTVLANGFRIVGVSAPERM